MQLYYHIVQKIVQLMRVFTTFILTLTKNYKLILKKERQAYIVHQINSGLKPDLCILDINAVDLHNGITDSDWDVVRLKQAMV